jgi:hypothetical protein
MRGLLVLFGLLLSLVTGELTLRLIYRDAGRSTLGGPGGSPFDHETLDGLRRGRLEIGRKTPGVPRVMVIGDSITYGLGVRDWRATWPERLAARLEVDGRPYQFAVLAVPGNDMPQHLEMMRLWNRVVQPDVLIYQWYVNDIEAISHRPAIEPPWRRYSWHELVRARSYLYYLLDPRLARVASHPIQSYESYLRTEFAPGTLEWAEFEREFHEFATLARSASRRIMMLYPQVPFRGAYPLQALHDRMRVMAKPHTLEIPPMAWVRAGRLVQWPGAPHGHVVEVTAGSAPTVVQTHDYLVAPGRLQATFTILAHGDTRELGRVHLVDSVNRTVIASAVLARGTANPLDELTVSFQVPGPESRRLAFQVESYRDAEWALANITMPVDYGFEVLDLTEPLNTFNTHTSSFDAHPNERAHQVMAEAAYAALAASTDGRSSPWRRSDADALTIPSIPAQARTITKASAGRR